MTVDRAGIISIAEECVALVGADFEVALDWTPGTLDALDSVCERLTGNGELEGDRFDLWWRLLGAYLGEVVVRTYDGRWISHQHAPGAYAVTAMGITGFPFSTVERVLRREPFKSLASFALSIPAIADRSDGGGPS